MRQFRSFSLVTTVMVCGLLVAGARAAAQQTPPPPQNLKVLPKDIARPPLTAIMRGYTAALGVQCTHCHVEDNTKRASDENPKKDIARKMIKMTMDINARYLQGVRDPALPVQPRVTCYTCHRGAVKPLTAAGGGH